MPTAPTPTEAPSAVLVAQRLFGRQDEAQTCGWVTANPDEPATCAVGSTCAVNTAYNVHFCCPSFPCTPPTTCYGYLEVQTACDAACQNNPLILRCPSGYNYCYTRTWHEATTLLGFGCATSPFIEDIYTTNSLGEGQIAAGSTFGLFVTTVVTTSNSSPTSSSRSGPTSGSGGSGSSPSESSGSSSSLGGGKIAGIAIGSAVVAAVIGFLLRLAFKRYRPRQRRIPEYPPLRRGSPTSSDPVPFSILLASRPDTPF